MRHLIAATCLQLVVSMHGIAEENSDFRIDVKKPGDSVKVEKTAESTVFVVKDQDGIGSATIKLQGKQWPEKVVVRLQRKQGESFPSLESFVFKAGQTKMEGRLKGGVKPQAERKEEEVGEKTLMPITAREGFIEVSLPVALLKGETEFSISWIDAYR